MSSWGALAQATAARHARAAVAMMLFRLLIGGLLLLSYAELGQRVSDLRVISNRSVRLLSSGGARGYQKQATAASRTAHPWMSSAALRVARTTALISVTRRPPSSSSSSPSIVHPAGVVTPSLSLAGCSPVCRTMVADPRTI